MNIERPVKPAAGSWTQAYPYLGTGDVDYSDSVSEEFHRKEMDAIFKQAWLNLGRIEQLPEPGSYFTKEMEFANTSLLVTRDKDGEVRAFHNMCSHRGNKLVWDEHPGLEVSGKASRFTCKYHAWTFGLDGGLLGATRKEEFFGLDRCKHGLTPISCDVWEGWIFVNFDPEPKIGLKEYLGELGEGLAGYPFHLMTQTYGFRAVINSNWKVFADSFSEAYHTPFMHAKMSPEMADDTIIADGLAFKLFGPHSTASFRHVPPAIEEATPIEHLTRCGLYGPWDKADIGMSEFPKAFNLAGAADWGIDSHQIFPNFAIVIWERNWYHTWQFWPLTVDKHLFECRQYFMPPKNARERLAQEMAILTTREYSLQDANTLEATHSMLKSGAKTHFPLSDQEIALRNLHYHAQAWVKAGGPPSAA